MWSGISVLLPALMQIRPLMPSALRRTIDYLIQPEPLTQKQYDKIYSLGESVGLSKQDVGQAVDTPGLEPSPKGMSKMALISSIVVIVVAVAVTIVGLWILIGPEASPIPTYTPGTDYGTIKPKDFDVLKHSSAKGPYSLFYKIYPR